jgi:hypothetical protein
MPGFGECTSFISGTTNDQGQLMKDLLPTQNCGLKCSSLGEDMPDRITSTHPNFPLPVTHDQIFGSKFEAPNPPEDKEADTESFVVTATKADAELQLKFELVKHIISARLSENEAARTAKERKEQKQKLAEILDRKKNAALENLSVEELEAALATA